MSLDLEEGEIHGLVGENGAGKSTLGKVIGGAVVPDSGQLKVAGRAVHYRAPRDALADGIALIAQEIALVPDRRVRENVFLGAEANTCGFVRESTLKERYEALIEEAGFALPANQRVARLRLADQQKVEILRALSRQARLIVMDEPTAALTHDESARLFEIVEGLRRRGTTILYISHFLEDVLGIADRVTVMKDGAIVRTGAANAETPESLIMAMLGRSLDATFPPRPAVSPDAETVLEIDGLSRTGAVDDITLELKAGEILGVAGLIGSGRSELARCIFGADRPDRGTIRISGAKKEITSPRAAIRHGIALLPESRKTQGLLMGRSIGENMTLAHLPVTSRWGFVRRRGERASVRKMMVALDVRAPSETTMVSHLSGGNQQKVLFGKWLFRMPRVLLADEPTRGVDIGAKRAIYELITSLAEQGLAVLLISSELEEVLGLAHRVVVMRGGRIVGRFDGPVIGEEDVMRAAFGDVGT